MLIKITEKDRQKAKSFVDHKHCLLATAIRRKLKKSKKKVHMLYDFVFIGKKGYDVEGPMACIVINERWGKPCYNKKVVGLKFTINET